jgi:hypothetical protein
MNSSTVAEIIKNISDIGLTGKYNSGSLTPMGLTGPTTNSLLDIQEPGAAYLAPVMKGGKSHRKSQRKSQRKSHRKSHRKSQRKSQRKSHRKGHRK